MAPPWKKSQTGLFPLQTPVWCILWTFWKQTLHFLKDNSAIKTQDCLGQTPFYDLSCLGVTFAFPVNRQPYHKGKA